MFAARPRAVLVGALFWILLGLLGCLVVWRSQSAVPAADGGARTPSVPAQIVNYFATRPEPLVLRLPDRVPLRGGEPIFTRDPAGDWIQAGYLTRSGNRGPMTAATAIWYLDAVDPGSCRFVYHRNRGRLGDVVQTLLPPEKRKRIERLIREAIEVNAAEITAAMRPIVSRSLAQSVPVVQRALRDSIAAHRDDLEKLGERYREVILSERLLPLVREEVMPIVRKHGEPVAQEIGRELWNRASLWRFGWRALYDKTPLPERDLFKNEWDRFVEEEAIPVFEKHLDEVIEAQRQILVDISKNPRIRNELREVIQQLAADEELQTLVSVIVRESILENRELREVWAENWRREDAQAAIRLAGARLEPVVRQIGDELFGTRESGISPTFARVLRNQVLGKDRRWFVATPTGTELHDGGPIPVEIATETEPFPLLILASPEQET